MEADNPSTDSPLIDDLRELPPDSAAKRLAQAIEAPPKDVRENSLYDAAAIDILADRRADAERLGEELAARLLKNGARELLDTIEALDD